MTPTLRFACHVVAAVVLVAVLGALSAVRANHYILCRPENDKCTDTAWSLTGSLNSPRLGHTATLMRDGKVLVTGGFDDTGATLATAELFDPATGTWAFTAPMTNARAFHFAFLLSSGDVVVIGGDYTCCFSNINVEVYNPDNDVWRPGASLNSPLDSVSAIMLPSGKIFLSGIADFYRNPFNWPTASWLYDPQQNVWTRARGDPIYRQSPSLSVLGDGTVLVTGGTRDPDEWLSAPGAEIYDPTTDTWTATSSPGTTRLHDTLTLLHDGTVLRVGGFRLTTLLSTSEVFGPDGMWQPVGNLNEGRMDHTATLLPNGLVLVAGGIASQPLTSTEIYDPLTANWTNAGPLNVARTGHTATLLENGTVLVVGGCGGGSSSETTVLRSAEIYHP